MELYIILGVITLGMVFIFIELFLIPGTAFVGVLGFIIAALGVYLTYIYQGSYIGNIVMVSAFAGMLFMLFIGLKKLRGWALSKQIDSKVNELDEYHVNIGDKGITFNTLRPNGTALINDERVEVFSQGGYIEPNTPIKIIKITNNKIFVKPINNT